MQTQDFKGIWIPRGICMLDGLGWTEKIMLSEIAMLSNPKDCYANNEHFSKILKITKVSVSRIISKLTKEGYLISEVKYKQNTKQIEQRVLKINWNFILNKIDNTSPQMCNSPSLKCDNDLPSKMLKIEYNRENNIENNIYAQNRVPTENSKQDENIQQRFERFYKAYPKKKSRGKAHTYTVERTNRLLRHYLARFAHKTYSISKSLDMIFYSLYLFSFRHLLPSISF